MIEISGGETYQAFGFRFGIRLVGLGGSFLTGAIPWTLEGLQRGCARPPDHMYVFEALRPNVVRLCRDGESLSEQDSEWVALSVMTMDINRQAVASRPERLTLHAGAVSLADHGILLPAGSGSGKSTLTAALVSAGCDYLSDEAVAVDLDSLVIEPYHKPLSLSPASLTVIGSPLSEHGPMELIPASWLRPDCWGQPVSPSRLVFPRHRAGSATVLVPVSRGEALVELANNSFNFVDHGGSWLPGLRDVVAGCECWRLEFGDAKEAARVVLEQLT